MTKDFIKKHPDLKETIETNKPCKLKTYTKLNESNRIIEKWERDANDELVDVTAQAIKKQKIELAKEEARNSRLELYRLQHAVKGDNNG